MRKLIFNTALILLTGIAFGQVLPKGTLIGTHAMVVNLNQGVTMDQYIEAIKTKVLPEWNKIDPDWQIYIVKSSRGNIWSNSFGLIHIVKSEEVRSKYINSDGSNTELQKAIMTKLTPVFDELNKYGTYSTTWTDWVIQ